MTSPLLDPTVDDVHVFPTPADFRAWLEGNHDTATELWVGYYKKGVPKQSMTYAQAVEEALCFGWIDGLTRRIDDEITSNRYTPRRKGSSWSAINIAKMGELKAAGRLHPAGQRIFEERDRRKDASYSYERPPAEIPPAMMTRLRADKLAWAFWESEQPSFRKAVAHWVTSAKRPETNERRFAELLEMARVGTRPKAFILERRDR
ncbi:MAG TPA: YdeI/OmpD-associated family protein [Candidatus Limnocylindria bacterium]|nr:YdeI/OmpD-associated family protein [Candidatus Limnocylindria bacterium]